MTQPEDTKPSAKASTASSSSSGLTTDERYYSLNPELLQECQQKKPWMTNATHLQKVAISPSAVVKMMQHCQSGVTKGVAQGGNPIEVMGLLLGRVDYHDEATSLIVTDAFPLPIEGFETRVIADDSAVINHMIALNECLERCRNEKFMGWYHSHPFDLGERSHCFLSQTDLSTQLQWQRAEDPHGNPFVALVVDPLRSLHQGTPELKAFRAYPPEYSGTPNQCPNGKIELSEQRRLEQWGSCWNRYYELQVDYYMSGTSRHVLNQLTSKYLWMTEWKRGNGASGSGSGNAAIVVDDKPTMDSIANTLAVTAPRPTMTTNARGRRRRAGGDFLFAPASSNNDTDDKNMAWKKPMEELPPMAVEELSQATVNRIQEHVFGKVSSSITAATTAVPPVPTPAEAQPSTATTAN